MFRQTGLGSSKLLGRQTHRERDEINQSIWREKHEHEHELSEQANRT
jgi:hypothetical protein